MTDREEAGLRHSVKTCGTQLKYVYPDKDWVMYTTDSYSSQGHLLERLHRNPDGSSWSIACIYDGEGRLIEKRHSGIRASAAQVFSYGYDFLGRLAHVMLQSADEGERVFQSVQYSTDGTRTETIYPKLPDGLDGQIVGVSSELMLHMSMDAAAIMTVFDASDRPFRKVLYDRDERVIHRVGFRYDERGLLVEEGELIGGQLRADFRNVFQHDTLGRKIDTRRFWGEWGGEQRTSAYNDHGDIVQELVVRIGGLPGLIEGKEQSWTERFSYQYDDRGNWIEQTKETIREDPAPCVSTIARREIAYY